MWKVASFTAETIFTIFMQENLFCMEVKHGAVKKMR